MNNQHRIFSTVRRFAFLSLAFAASSGIGVWLSSPQPAMASTTCTGGVRPCNAFITACEDGGGYVTSGCFDSTTGLPTCFSCDLD